MMEICKTNIPGCFELLPKVFEDERGSFVKTFHEEIFEDHGLETDFKEEYYSVSFKNVLRGFHFQLPPKAHTKVVYCVLGEVIDMVVDLRVGSPTYQKYSVFNINSNKANSIYIPVGLAHGFYVVSEIAVMLYKVSTVYAKEHDTGILWNSIGVEWQNKNPIVSERDSQFVEMKDFVSPFNF